MRPKVGSWVRFGRRLKCGLGSGSEQFGMVVNGSWVLGSFRGICAWVVMEEGAVGCVVF